MGMELGSPQPVNRPRFAVERVCRRGISVMGDGSQELC